MTDLHGMVSIPYFNGASFTGSDEGICYRLWKETEDDGPVLRAAAWPGPFAYASTPDEEKTFEKFPFDNDGIEAAVAWINEYCAARK